MGPGYEWAAVNGTGAFRVLRTDVEEALAALTEGEESRCRGVGWLTDGRRLVIEVGPCILMGDTEPDNLLVLDLDLEAGAIARAQLVPVGERIYLQAWHREENAVLVGVGKRFGGDAVRVVALP